ncbi:MAG: cytochrome c maturation protein CcmE [Alphaproteobacteria bacterium]|nr:cytochrome c maturation protein CcmE [Alphaproteobacteria bacterium]|tara:strand:- start:404 stop:817 length:414 start_codon:yes stop_codon:yes gene_type:complete
MTPKKKRFYLLFSAFTFFCFIVGTILIVLQDNILFFYTPSEILEKDLKQDEKVRLGGLVEENSVARNDTKINFTITDLKKTIEVTYEGILPDLFREGQGVIVKGYLQNNIFEATEVLAKHDENYMPPEIKKKLKKLK